MGKGSYIESSVLQRPKAQGDFKKKENSQMLCHVRSLHFKWRAKTYIYVHITHMPSQTCTLNRRTTARQRNRRCKVVAQWVHEDWVDWLKKKKKNTLELTSLNRGWPPGKKWRLNCHVNSAKISFQTFKNKKSSRGQLPFVSHWNLF